MRHLPSSPRLFLLLLAASALCLCAMDWDSADFRLLDTGALHAAAQAVTAQRYPDAESVQLDSSTLIVYEADGRFFQVVDMAEKLLTEKSCKESKVLTSSYDTAYSRAKIPLVQVIHPDGHAEDIDLERFSEDIIDNSMMEANIYTTSSRMVRVTIPELAPGDIVRAIYVDETLKPRIPDAFYDHFLLESMAPILHERIQIDGPESLPLRQIALRNPVGAPPVHTVDQTGGRIRHTWELSAIPQAFDEPGMPPLYACGQHLLVSTFDSWEKLSRWYWELSEPHLKTDDAITKAVASLTEGLDNYDARLRAIFDFVSQQIRYMGIIAEGNAPGYEPHDVTRTFADRAGVCRDKAALLVAMLRLAGMEAYPVLIHTHALKDPEVPQAAFNHAITAVRRPDGAIQLMDATAENTRDLFPSYLCGKSYLMATPDGFPLMTSEITPYTENLSTIRSTAMLQDDWTLAMESEVTFNGIDDRAYRDFLLSAPPDQQRLFFERQASSAVPGARLTSLRLFPKNLQDTSQPLRVKFSLEIPQTLVMQGGKDNDRPADGALALLRLPRLSGAFGLVHRIFTGATLEKRRFPMQAPFTIGIAEELSIVLPDGLGVKSLPEFTPVKTPETLFERQIVAFPGRLIYRNTMASNTMEYSPSQYLSLKKALRQVESDSRKMPILVFGDGRTGADGGMSDDLVASGMEDRPDAEVLEETTTIRFEHENFWTTTTKVKCRILTYQGSRDCAELSFNYMPMCQSVQVKNARVINGDQVLEPDEKMVNTMDMPSGTAPRYPVGKCLVVNLPGVEVGSVIEYEVVQEEFNRPFASGCAVLQNNYPAQERTLVIDVPEEMEIEPELLEHGWLDLAIQGPRRATHVSESTETDKENGRRIFTWRARRMPADYREAGQLPGHAYLPTVCFSNGKWRSYAAMLRKAIEELGDGGEAVASKAAEFQGANGYERLRRLWNWFDQNIRAAGPAFNTMPIDQLTRPETTLRDRYGNSADRAILLAALLRAAGFSQVELYLANSAVEHEDLQDFNAAFPSPSFSGSMLVRLLCEGHEVWLNDQNRYLHFGTCSHDRGLLLSIDDGGLSRMKLPASLAEHTETTTRMELADSGSARISIRQSVFGVAYGQAKKHFLELQPEERRRAYQKTLASLSQNAVPVTPDYVLDFDSYPGIVSYTADIKDYAVADADYYYLRLPISPAGFFPGADAETRLTPLYWAGRHEETRRLTLLLPPSYQQVAMLPPARTWKAPGGGGTVQWRCRWLPGDGSRSAVIEATLEIQRAPAIIQPDNYAEARDAARQMGAPQYVTILLKRTDTAQE